MLLLTPREFFCACICASSTSHDRQDLEEPEEPSCLLLNTHSLDTFGSINTHTSHSLAVSAEGDGLGLHAEHVSGGVLGVLSAHESLAAGLQRDPGQGGVRRCAHVAPGSLAASIGVNRQGEADEEDDGEVHHVASVVRRIAEAHMWLPA